MSRVKRLSVRIKLQIMVLVIVFTALAATSIAAVTSMQHIRMQAMDAFIGRVEHNLINIVSNKAETASAQFNLYMGYEEVFSRYIEQLYLYPEEYGPQTILPPDPNDSDFSVKRYIASEDISFDSLEEECALLGNAAQIFAPVVEGDDSILAVYLSTERGLQISYDKDSKLTAHSDGSEVYYNYFDRPWYVKAKEKKEICFTDVYDDAYNRGSVVTCAAPFYDAQDNFAGVVCIDMLIDHVYSLLVDFDIIEGKEDYAFLVDGNGFAVAKEYRERNIENHPEIGGTPICRKIMEGETGLSRAGDKSYFAYAPIEGIDWKLCLRVPQADVIAPVDAMDQKIRATVFLFVVIFIVVFMLAAFMVRQFSRSITKPIFALQKDAEEISGGNLEHEAVVYYNDEIGDLAVSFNNMASSLKDYIANLTAVTAEKERIGAELSLATQIQADMLPRIFPPFPEQTDFDLFATMTPAKEVGGDFYDFFLIDPDHLCLVMADVSGKGVPAALFMVIAKTLIKNRATLGGSPAEILAYANDQLCEGNDAELFVTAWVGILEISTGKGVAANAGHEHPVIKRAGGDFELVVYRHSPAVATIEGITFREHAFELHKGDTLFVYTDGVPEATSGEDELFGEERMIDALNACKDQPIDQILSSMKKTIDAFVGSAPQFDDITMMILNYYGPEEKA